MEKKPVKEIVAKKLPTKKYKLLKNIPVSGGKGYKIGESIELTEKGRKYFKQLNRI